ncbi:unnamed protein product, partial [Amoebophrya sp. A120]
TTSSTGAGSFLGFSPAPSSSFLLHRKRSKTATFCFPFLSAEIKNHPSGDNNSEKC